jgi:hypothetical protein
MYVLDKCQGYNSWWLRQSKILKRPGPHLVQFVTETETIPGYKRYPTTRLFGTHHSTSAIPFEFFDRETTEETTVYMTMRLISNSFFALFIASTSVSAWTSSSSFLGALSTTRRALRRTTSSTQLCMKTIAVFGASGLTASECVYQALKNGDSVVGLTR